MRLRELILTLDNVRRMGPVPIAARLYKKVYFKALARPMHALFPPIVGPAARRRRSLEHGEPLLDDALAYLRHVVRSRPSRGLFDLEDRATLIEYVQRHAEDAIARHVEAADRWARFEVDLLGHPTWQAVEPIDWTADPYGNREWTWSLVRLPFLEPLVKAHLATEDPSYLRALRRWLLSFWERAPHGSETCFESYSIARRLLRLAFLLFAALDTELFDASFAEAYLSHVLGEAHKLRWHLERENPTNHLFLNYQALFTVGVLFPEYAPARRWRALGWRGFRRELRRQFFADHGHREQCTGYHLGMLEKIGETLWLARRQGFELNDRERERAHGAYRFARALTTKAGTLPPLGDSPVRRYDEVGTSGALFFRDVALLPPGRTLHETDVFRLSAHALRALPKLVEREPSGARAVGERDVSGYRVYRGEGDGLHLVFDTGPIGHGCNPGHGHADALSIVLAVGRDPVLVDPGVSTYATGEWLTYAHSTRAHNTLTVDGRDQCVIWKGGRRKAFLPRVRGLATPSSHANCLWGGRHDGYARARDGVVHERWLAVVDDRYLLVFDRVSGSGGHAIDVHWHFAPGELACASDGTFRFRGARAWAGVVASSHAMQVRNARGERNPLQGFVSTDFGRVVEAPVLVQSMQMEGATLDALFALSLVQGVSAPEVRHVEPERAVLGVDDGRSEVHWSWTARGTPELRVDRLIEPRPRTTIVDPQRLERAKA